MKKILFASALLLAIAGTGFAQTTPAHKAPEKTTTHKHVKHHAGKKEKEEKKDNKQGQ